ncbi:hypothetical protein CAPTEDRAFT_185884 [Capitella teleta]|uniref:Uncharacterized protein n=1 Tax=Capitella teleta TaxID=283909 RepID=R7TD66_CAPTE|nr:hypothetical protein CAPTEDRAFT_185884 [Capitella teleta]|eukprot:ELT91683.1 hypothetical protein CAPTEDRAFT_185884 [Capitella teleta]
MAQSQMDSFLCQHRGFYLNNMISECDEASQDRSNDSTIHSGHFMVSCVHEDPDPDEPESPPTSKDDDTQDEVIPQGFDFDNANQETSTSYQFGTKSPENSAIDASLTKLFECMTLAYSCSLYIYNEVKAGLDDVTFYSDPLMNIRYIIAAGENSFF